MGSRGCRLRWAASFLLLIKFSLAQTPYAAYEPGFDRALIEKGLQSTLPLQVAVSAYRAGQDSDHHPQWGNSLRKALAASLALQPEAEAFRVKRIILEALIRSRTRVPLVELLPFFDRFPAAVIAIVAKGARDNPALAEDRLPLLLKAETLGNRIYWMAAASLVDRKQLVHYLAQQVKFNYPIYVSDQDFVPALTYDLPGTHTSLGGIPGGVMGGVMGGVANQNVYWPDETVYRLALSGGMNEALTCCVGGQTYLRAWSPPDPEFYMGERGGQLPEEWDRDREMVLALLSFAHCKYCSRATPDFPMIRGEKSIVVSHSEDQLRHSLTEAAEQYVQECSRMFKALEETGFSDTEIRAKVRIWIQDRRRVTATPIPELHVGVVFSNCQSSLAGYCGK